MQERHSNRERYFQEQGLLTATYAIPYINEFKVITSEMHVAEMGCGEGGNMKPFLEMGCRVTGIDISKTKIENAEKFFAGHPQRENLTLIAEDVYNIPPESIEKFDLIYLRDVIEHIPNQEKFLAYIKDYLKPGGVIFFGFPPWRMPFGGHQQVCKSKLLSKLPYFHLLPMPLFKAVLRLFGESEATVQSLVEVKETGISINRFRGIIKHNKLRFCKEDYFLINPNYEIKFNLKPRKLPALLNIPWLRDFYTTAYYCIIGA
ncbi:MAG: class I SAM-dependent methyltransferase [Flavobacteriales bacterium]|nr:class I SAM-dependent methyltransferase [Flavobacteriales bacterium]